jgi:hypothetical protein
LAVIPFLLVNDGHFRHRQTPCSVWLAIDIRFCG